MRKTISYFIDPDTNLLISRVNSNLGVPILDYKSMKPENKYSMKYYLEKIDIFENIKWYNALMPISNKKIKQLFPMQIINAHRKLFDLKTLSQ